MTNAWDFEFTAIDGQPLPMTTFRDHPVLVVNVASKCGLTPQYDGLEKLYAEYRDQGLVVLGVPCNQFMGQEPGTAEEIQEFCATNYGVDFPLLAKTDVNGDGRHPLYAELTRAADTEGAAGDVQWNFEKFLVSREGEVLARFRPGVTPEDPALVNAVEKSL
ncbi:MAG: glutathione peroxidase [Caulobacter sp.]|nr:glutathione peroxidase [Caulobacter sp.]